MARKLAEGYATPYAAIQYRSSIDHFRIVSIAVDSRERFGSVEYAMHIWPIELFGVPFWPFFHRDSSKREREREPRRKDGELDGLFVQGNRVSCYLSSGLPCYDCIAKSPLTVSGFALLARIYICSCTHG